MIRTSSAPMIVVAVAAVISSFLLVATASGVANAAEIKVLSAVGVKPVMIELIPQFEQSSGHKVKVDYGTVGALVDRVQKGEGADVVIVSGPQIDVLEKQGKVASGSRVDFTKLGVGVFVRKGAPKPDVSSVEALQRTLLAAQSIGHADPARGGAISAYVAGLLGRLDIAAEIKPKIKLFPPSDYDLIAKGDIEIGFGGISEILAAPGVELVGSLPAAIQHYTLFAAGIAASSKEQEAGKAFMQFLSSPAAAAVLKAKSFERP
ncbi:MAG: substrate-binding domain-containing protein [Betaproteobacteria bacterium]|nr:substrate-binding domain-containing protein [Betaproteobacteria bacterium]MBI3054271.1 substrate-binding domain-containing protein [Betaproteobacteria bacterium]